MNYLGHIYFSNNNPQLAVANLFGDFTKGKKYLEYPEYIQKGVLLHRKIDNYIDHHHAVLELIHLIRPELPKVAPIAIDIYFDHLLAIHWKQYHPQELQFFLTDFYSKVNLSNTPYPSDFKQFIHSLIERNWLSYYPTEEGLYRMCQGVSNKLSFDNALKQGHEVFYRFQNEITSCFHEYMRDANEYLMAPIL
ncbi:ACP phosphodiesterase [Fluviicola taffensis]|uniref:Acyl carrier protein phosphodiesterase n=1 Tax=Fluviicola taffensis (strain DSM 16823 / NCIMB 13979 / RW262) TaxID=755732 RepID=F2IE13_FLUTR|nr:acyl carrier protein phosphodiesterase [Fluviicola taffensis]AEA45577.1 Acyl carrier protein phosphodiesterase [Fluviicola taffensis DSM 16823]